MRSTTDLGAMALKSQNGHNTMETKTMTHTIALNNDNEFEYLASILATWDETYEGVRHKRHALDQLLVRSEIDGYEKERINGDRDFLLWKKPGSDLEVRITRIEDGIYNVKVQTDNIIVRAIGIEEL